MSKKADQYKNLPNPALSYISTTPNMGVTEGLDMGESTEDFMAPPAQELERGSEQSINVTQEQMSQNDYSLKLRRKVEFTKSKPTRTQRAQLVFFPEDYKLAKRAAKLEGVSFNEWATATLAAAAQDTLEDYGQKA